MEDQQQLPPKKNRPRLKMVILVSIGLIIGLVVGMIIGPMIFVEEDPPDARIILTLELYAESSRVLPLTILLNGKTVYEGGMGFNSVLIKTIDIHYPEGAVQGQQVITILTPGGFFESQSRTVNTELGGNYAITIKY